MGGKDEGPLMNHGTIRLLKDNKEGRKQWKGAVRMSWSPCQIEISE